MKKNNTRLVICILGLMLVLPVLGAIWAGKPIEQYLEFPPVTQYVQHADFSWVIFMLMAGVILLFVLPFEWSTFRCKRIIERRPSSVCAFPWWGWAGIVLGIVSWILAWTRFDWFMPLQIYIFTPLWFSYVITVNAFTYKRTGHCMIIDRPAYMVRLLVASAFFWWFFEYLNRFVQNWFYEGVGNLDGLEYFLMATFPFSTVLPAVMGTYELLVSYPRVGAGLDDFIKIPVKRPVLTAWIALLLFCCVLLVLGIWPDCMFPFLWVAPLIIITSIQRIMGRETIWTGVGHGRWKDIYLFALSALICGVFWEFWNFHSYAKWKYSVPFVDALKIFEMPLLGFAGYLPFGLECAVIAYLVAGRKDYED